MSDAERLSQIRELLEVLLAPTSLGEGPIRLESWGEWSQAQREAYEAMRQEAYSRSPVLDPDLAPEGL